MPSNSTVQENKMQHIHKREHHVVMGIKELKPPNNMAAFKTMLKEGTHESVYVMCCCVDTFQK